VCVEGEVGDGRGGGYGCVCEVDGVWDGGVVGGRGGGKGVSDMKRHPPAEQLQQEKSLA
jgi:hypothetical protein